MMWIAFNLSLTAYSTEKKAFYFTPNQAKFLIKSAKLYPLHTNLIFEQSNVIRLLYDQSGAMDEEHTLYLRDVRARHKEDKLKSFLIGAGIGSGTAIIIIVIIRLAIGTI